jgi:hypothetical protein
MTQQLQMLFRHHEGECALGRQHDRRISIGVESEFSIPRMIEMMVIELVWSGRELSGRQECADVVGENAHETGRRPFSPCRGETTLLLRLAHSGQPTLFQRWATTYVQGSA